MDYAADVAAYDSVHMEILGISDFFTEGIVREFPQMFPFRTSQQSITLGDNAIVLDQNSPHPFADQTTIHYFIPENVSDVK